MKMQSLPNKAFVLGLDGASPEFLEQLMGNGLMPNLKRLHSEGTSGVLHSTKPPFTAPAWVSCCSGVNPGKHGIFGFTTRQNGELNRSLISSRSVRTRRIWHYINGSGKSVGLINIPITYPVEPVDGFMVPCFLTPSGKKNFTYPKNLYRELLEAIGQYIINVKIAGRQLAGEQAYSDFLDDILFSTQKRFEAMRFLYEKYTPDFFMVVFTCLDKIQHKCWKYLDNTSPLYHSPLASRIRPRLLQVYYLVDEIIAFIIANLDSNTTLYIVSDHGFGPYDKRVYLNKWLLDSDFLRVRKTKLFLSKLRTRVKLAKDPFVNLNLALAKRSVEEFYDPKKTLFYCGDVYEQGVYFNHQRKGFSGDVNAYKDQCERLKQAMLSLIDPSSGDKLVDEVRFRDEIYWGPYLHLAPDISVKMRNYSYLINKGIPLKSNTFLQPVEGPEGCHRPEGIFIAYGSSIKPANKVEASIFDVTPTILYNLGIPVAAEMDGRILTDIFHPAYVAARKTEYRNAEVYLDHGDPQLRHHRDRDEIEIKARLKDLGYFD
jgi:predicted AlkP superfamily phosphohydrolase/phosphomutase